MGDQKSPFIFNNDPFLCLLKLIAASPLINLYPTQKAPSDDIRCFLCSFLPGLICMRIFTLCRFTWLPAWKYVTICYLSSLRTTMFFPLKKYILHTEHMHWRLCWGEWQFSLQFCQWGLTVSSLEREDPLPSACPGYNTKLYLMVRLWRSGKCGVPLHCHYWQIQW